MRQITLIAVLLALVFASHSVFAAEEGKKGASAMAYEHASDEAIFHRVGDWFATIGKSEEEKTTIIAERKAKRATLRAQKQAEKQQMKMQQQRQRVRQETGRQKGKARKIFE